MRVRVVCVCVRGGEGGLARWRRANRSEQDGERRVEEAGIPVPRSPVGHDAPQRLAFRRVFEQGGLVDVAAAARGVQDPIGGAAQGLELAVCR